MQGRARGVGVAGNALHVVRGSKYATISCGCQVVRSAHGYTLRRRLISLGFGRFSTLSTRRLSTLYHRRRAVSTPMPRPTSTSDVHHRRGRRAGRGRRRGGHGPPGQSHGPPGQGHGPPGQGHGLPGKEGCPRGSLSLCLQELLVRVRSVRTHSSCGQCSTVPVTSARPDQHFLRTMPDDAGDLVGGPTVPAHRDRGGGVWARRGEVERARPAAVCAGSTERRD